MAHLNVISVLNIAWQHLWLSARQPGQLRQQERLVKKVPVLIARDWQRNLLSKMLDYMWWEDIGSCFVGRIAPITPVEADTLAQHDRFAEHLRACPKLDLCQKIIKGQY